MLLEQFAANGPRLQLYNLAEKHWEDLMNWQHATMYLFFGLAGTVCLIIHTTEAAPLALDRLMLAIAFFNEGRRKMYRPGFTLTWRCMPRSVHLKTSETGSYLFLLVTILNILQYYCHSVRLQMFILVWLELTTFSQLLHCTSLGKIPSCN